MIEQWMHVRAKNTDRFLFENSTDRPKFNDGKKFRFSSAKVSHRPIFVVLQYKEIKRKEGANQKWMKLEKNNNQQ